MDCSKTRFNILAFLYQFRLRKQLIQYTLQLIKGLRQRRRARDDYNIISWKQTGMRLANRCPQAAFGAIPHDSRSKPPAGHKAIAVMRPAIGAKSKRHGRMSIEPAMRLNVGEIGRASQPQRRFHRLAGVPIHLLDVVGRNRQLMAAAAAARFKNPAAIAGTHAFAKAMNTFAAANLGLPSAFG